MWMYVDIFVEIKPNKAVWSTIFETHLYDSYFNVIKIFAY